MSFLDENGLTYFYGKLKEKFVQTITTTDSEGQAEIQTPDIHGNISINNVASANNLTSTDALANYGSFIYRTAGGSASISSGEAQLVYIDGNIDIVGRVIENFAITSTNNIDTTYSANIWRSQISEDGTYVFTYIRPTSSATAMSWTASGTWSYGGSQISMNSFGLYPTNVINPSINITTSGSEITGATVVPSTFFSQINTDATTTFDYTQDEEQNVGWMLNETLINLTTYGISISGNPTLGDTITVVSVVGTPNSTLTVNYTAPQQGTIIVATPTVFSATGFNQFDQNSMVLTNASFNDGKIIQNSGTYACYCHAKGGVTNGYVAYSESGTILDIGWCANIPTIGADIITTDQSVTNSLASIPFNEDGYVVVIASSTADICIHPQWSGGLTNTTFEAYTAPSTITIPTVDIEDNNLPTASYGMPRIGSIADRINLDVGVYIQRIGRLQNTSSNMDYVVSLETQYDYDNNFIYYVLPEPIIYTIDINSTYTANDYGTEEFIGTNVPLGIQVLYGQNLRDKLRTDVVTLSPFPEPVSSAQQANACNNIGAVKRAGDTMTGNLYINNGGQIVIKNNEYASGDTPDPSSYRWYYLLDKDNHEIGCVASVISRTESGLQLRGYSYATGSPVYNQLGLYVDKQGNRRVSVNDAAAWRIALGGTGANGICPVSLGGTAATSTTNALSNLGTFDYKTQGVVLAQGTNIDTDLEFGKTYYIGAATAAAKLSGTLPVTTTGFKIIQFRGYHATSYDVQIAVSGASALFHYRVRSSGTWGDWVSPVTSAQIIAIGKGGTGGSGTTSITQAASATTPTIAEATTNFTIDEAVYSYWGKIAMVRIKATRTGTSITTAADMQVCTMVGGRRPATTAIGSTQNATIDYTWFNQGGSVYVHGTWAQNAQKTLVSTYLVP